MELNYQMFADANTQTTGGLSAEMKTYYGMELLENAGLAYWRNDIFEMNPEYSQSRIRSTMNGIIYRRYLYNGEGSFFPMNYCHTDVRKQELLVQMNNYLAENYDIC